MEPRQQQNGRGRGRIFEPMQQASSFPQSAASREDQSHSRSDSPRSNGNHTRARVFLPGNTKVKSLKQ